MVMTSPYSVQRAGDIPQLWGFEKNELWLHRCREPLLDEFDCQRHL